MDVTDESGGRRDAQSTLAAVTATSEARIRTLNNKVRRGVDGDSAVQSTIRSRQRCSSSALPARESAHVVTR